MTWAVLMEGGLGLVAKFKLVTESSWEAMPACDRLPSWAVDWRLTARLFCEKPSSPDTQRSYTQMRAELDEPELKAAWFAYQIPDFEYFPRFERVWLAHPPGAHDQFRRDNCQDSGLSPKRLVIRGYDNNRFYCAGRKIMVNRGMLRSDELAWQLDIDSRAGDCIVSPCAFVGVCFGHENVHGSTWKGDRSGGKVTFERHSSGGLWLLRPHDRREGEYEVIAILLFRKSDLPIYRTWFYRGQVEDPALYGVPKEACVRRLALMPSRSDLGGYAEKSNLDGIEQKFIII